MKNVPSVQRRPTMMQMRAIMNMIDHFGSAWNVEHIFVVGRWTNTR